MEKPKIELVGQDGNVFAVMGRASRALKQAGMADEAKEMFDRVTSCGNYYEGCQAMWDASDNLFRKGTSIRKIHLTEW